MLIVVRHGRTPANAAGLLQGRSDYQLDEVGRDQAARLARAVGHIDRLVASPLPRAIETAEAFGRPIEIDERWREIDYGALEGRPISEVPDAYWRGWTHDPDFAPEGSESHRELHLRVIEAATDLLEDARTRDVCVVTHVSPIKAVIGWIMDKPHVGGSWCRVDHASISRVGHGRFGHPILLSFNETGHLTDH